MARPFELSDDTKALVACLKAHDKGSRLTYSDISRLSGVTVKSGSPRLTYARTILLRDHAQVWVAVRPKIGLLRLDDAGIAERLPNFWLNGARSKLKRGGDQSDVVEVGQLDIDQQARFAVDSIQRQLSLDAISKATRKKLERVARGTSNDLPSFTAVEWAISLSPKAQQKK